jgi:hypothetical protein
MKHWPILFALFINVAHLHSDDIDVTQPLRIHELIPREEIPSVLAIEPALPKDFIALGAKGDQNYCDWVYWGTEKAIKDFLKDEKLLSEPLIRVKLSTNFAQREYGSFDEKEIRDEFSQIKAPKISTEFGKWGSYPYCLLSSPDDEKIHSALVGMNDEGNGNVLMFQLVTPQKPGLKVSALQLWKYFFENTKELPEPLLFKAHGQEMHPGYTIVDVVGHKIKIIAERRRSDQKIQFGVIPEDQIDEFKPNEAFLTLMGANWHHNEPLLKISGQFVIDKGWFNLFTTASILIQEVEEFTSILPQKNVIVAVLE